MTIKRWKRWNTGAPLPFPPAVRSRHNTQPYNTNRGTETRPDACHCSDDYTDIYRSKNTLGGHWNCLFIPSHCYLYSQRSRCVREHPITAPRRWAEPGGVFFDSVPVDSTRGSRSGPPLTFRFLLQRRSRPDRGEEAPRGGHDPNPQLADCAATGRRGGPTWETFPRTRVKPRNSPGSGANVAKYFAKPLFSIPGFLFPLASL